MTTPFRQAALDARRDSPLGEILLIRPPSFFLLTLISLLFVALVGVFFFFGSYTKRSTVSGQLVPDTGWVRVHAAAAGVVTKKRVVEGQSVLKGDVLYEISSALHSATLDQSRLAISAQIDARRHSLQSEVNQLQQLQQEDKNTLREKVLRLEAEQKVLSSQLAGQKSRVALVQEAHLRNQDLLQKGYISLSQMQREQEAGLEQTVRLHVLERDQAALARELAEQKHALANLPLKQKTQSEQLQRDLSSVQQEWLEAEARRNFVVTAPENGTVTWVLAEPGAVVNSATPLLHIVPEGAKLEAHLYVPSKAIGFIRSNDVALLRFQAYPYQKFGQLKGQVRSISHTALAARELGDASTISGALQVSDGDKLTAEPVYRVIVSLPTQTISAYGKPEKLKAGMLLEASVLQDTRRIYEWVIEPLLALGAKW